MASSSQESFDHCKIHLSVSSGMKHDTVIHEDIKDCENKFQQICCTFSCENHQEHDTQSPSECPNLRPGVGSAAGDTGSSIRHGTGAGPPGVCQHPGGLGWPWPRGSTSLGSAASQSGSALSGRTHLSPAGGSGGSASPSPLAPAG